jgi:hypothetical protein
MVKLTLVFPAVGEVHDELGLISRCSQKGRECQVIGQAFSLDLSSFVKGELGTPYEVIINTITEVADEKTSR